MAAEKFFIKKILGEDAASPEAKDSPAMGAFIYNGSNARSKRVWVISSYLSISLNSASLSFGLPYYTWQKRRKQYASSAYDAGSNDIN